MLPPVGLALAGIGAGIGGVVGAGLFAQAGSNVAEQANTWLRRRWYVNEWMV
jgi:hypothetical protein